MKEDQIFVKEEFTRLIETRNASKDDRLRGLYTLCTPNFSAVYTHIGAADGRLGVSSPFGLLPPIFPLRSVVAFGGHYEQHVIVTVGLIATSQIALDMGHLSIREPREVLNGFLDSEHWSVRQAEVLRMLSPRRAGSVGPEEIGDGPSDKGASGGATSGSVTPGGSYENGDNSKEFQLTGRTGRRNALPDILGRHAETGLSDLSDRFEELSTHPDHSSSGGQDPNIPGTSKQHG